MALSQFLLLTYLNAMSRFVQEHLLTWWPNSCKCNFSTLQISVSIDEVGWAQEPFRLKNSLCDFGLSSAVFSPGIDDSIYRSSRNWARNRPSHSSGV